MADLTLLVGENNTGKTFFATVLSRVLGASPVSSSMSPVFRSQSVPLPDIPAQLRRWLRHLSSDFERDDPEPAAPWISPASETLDWVRRSTTDYLESYATDMRGNIEYAFGVEAAELRRRKQNQPSSDCYVRVRNRDPSWEVKVRFDSDTVTVVPPDPLSLLRRVFRPDGFHDSPSPSRYGSRAPRVGSWERYWPLVRRELHRGWMTNLYTRWPRQTIHIPAGRTGIMQICKVITGAVVRHPSAAGIGSIELDRLPGTAADFLSILLQPGRGPGHTRRMDPKEYYRQHRLLIQDLEKALGASIRRDGSVELGEIVVAVTREGRFPLSQTSSVLSELAPVLLVLKGSTMEGDHITIDEPEAHLHPGMQRTIASFITDIVHTGIRMVITTHSDFFIGQINNAIRSGQLNRMGAESSRNSTTVCALQFSREQAWCIAKKLDIDHVNGIDESTFTDVMSSLYNESADLIDGLLN